MSRTKPSFLVWSIALTFLMFVYTDLARAEQISVLTVLDKPPKKIPSLLLSSSSSFDSFDAAIKVADDANQRGCQRHVKPGLFNDSIALIEDGECSLDTKLQFAKEAGAKAIIIYSNSNSSSLSDIPFKSGGCIAILVSEDDGMELKEVAKRKLARVEVDSLFGMWSSESSCRTESHTRAVLAKCLKVYATNVHQHYHTLHACNNAAMDMLQLQECVHKANRDCRDALHADCQKQALTGSFGFTPFAENRCFPLPHSCDLLWKVNADASFLKGDPYKHTREMDQSELWPIRCDPDPFYDPVFHFNTQYALDWGYISATRQAVPECALDDYNVYIQSLNRFASPDKKISFVDFCRGDHLTFYRKLYSCFTSQCQRNMRYRCSKGESSHLYQFKTAYFDKQCGGLSCEEIFNVQPLDDPNDYACKVSTYYVYPEYICAVIGPLYLGVGLAITLALLIAATGRWSYFLFALTARLFGALVIINYHSSIDWALAETWEDEKYSNSQAWWNAGIAFLCTFCIVELLRVVFERILVYDLQSRQKCYIRFYRAYFQCATISWTWDIADSERFEESPRLRECFAKASDLGFRYVVLDVVTLSEGETNPSSVLKFIGWFVKLPVIIGLNQGEVASYERRFWAQMEMIHYLVSGRKKVMIDNSDYPVTRQNFHSVFDDRDLRSGVNLDRLTAFLLTVPFGEALLTAPLKEIEMQNAMGRDVLFDSLADLIAWSMQMNWIMDANLLRHNAKPVELINSPFLFILSNFFNGPILAGVPIQFTFQTITRRPILGTNGNGLEMSDSYLNVLGIVHPILFGIIMGVVNKQLGFVLSIYLGLLVMPFLLKSSLLFCMGLRLRAKLRDEIEVNGVSLPVSMTAASRKMPSDQMSYSLRHVVASLYSVVQKVRTFMFANRKAQQSVQPSMAAREGPDNLELNLL